jgi:hypothetical protein
MLLREHGQSAGAEPVRMAPGGSENMCAAINDTRHDPRGHAQDRGLGGALRRTVSASISELDGGLPKAIFSTARQKVST